jgi:hypothetical protein
VSAAECMFRAYDALRGAAERFAAEGDEVRARHAQSLAAKVAAEFEHALESAGDMELAEGRLDAVRKLVSLVKHHELTTATADESTQLLFRKAAENAEWELERGLTGGPIINGGA